MARVKNAQERSLYLAIARGEHEDKRYHTRVTYQPPTQSLLTFEGPKVFYQPGGAYVLLTFEGPVSIRMTGEFRFQHHDTEVLAVNFDDGWITDVGYHDYSITTNRRLADWLRILGRFVDLPHRWWTWTQCWRPPRPTSHRNRSPADPEVDLHLVRFRTHAPWLEHRALNRRTDALHFYWNRFDAALATAFEHSRAFLAQDQNVRYFVYDWAPGTPTIPLPHHWARHFIDDDAKRRWYNRERRNGRPCLPISSPTKRP